MKDQPELDVYGNVDEVIASVDASWSSWRDLTAVERARRLRPLRHAIVERQDALVKAIRTDTGKPTTEIVMQEITASLATLRFLESKYPRWLRARRFRYLRPGLWTKSNRIYYDSIGVVAIVGPSNFPFSLVVMQSAAALLCGNAVIIKPAESCPQTAESIRAVLTDAGLLGPVNLVQGGPGVVERLIAHPVVKRVLFTGSLAAGRAVAEGCGRHFKPCTLELGGHGIAIVCDDANFELAARGLLWSALYTDQNSCIGTREVLAMPQAYEPFVKAIRAEALAIRIGNAGDPDADVSIDSAAERTVATLVGGAMPGDAGFAVHRIRSVDDAIAHVNGSRYGLSASVWSRTPKRARAIARRLRVGMVWVNDASVGLPRFPWGGTRSSGWGRLFAREALPELTQLKAVSSERRRFGGAKFWWFPYTREKRSLTMHVNQALYGRKGFGAVVQTLRAAVMYSLRRRRTRGEPRRSTQTGVVATQGPHEKGTVPSTVDEGSGGGR